MSWESATCPIERLHLSIERCADDLEGGLELGSADDTEQSLLIEEVKVGCTLAMLQCLDRPHRAAYVLGEIMELSGPESALADAGEHRPVQFARRATSFQEARTLVRRVDEARWALEAHRSSQPRASSIDFA